MSHANPIVRVDPSTRKIIDRIAKRDRRKIKDVVALALEQYDENSTIVTDLHPSPKKSGDTRQGQTIAAQ